MIMCFLAHFVSIRSFVLQSYVQATLDSSSEVLELRFQQSNSLLRWEIPYKVQTVAVQCWKSECSVRTKWCHAGIKRQ
jgi:hypothetical protein